MCCNFFFGKRPKKPYIKDQNLQYKFWKENDPPPPAAQNGPYLWKSCAVHALPTIWPSYLLAYMQPYMVPPICEGFVSIIKEIAT